MSAKDGLLHADDLAYSKDIGLIIANESQPNRQGKPNGPGVFAWKEGRFSRLADPLKFLIDTGSLAVRESVVYASDGAREEIYKIVFLVINERPLI